MFLLFVLIHDVGPSQIFVNFLTLNKAYALKDSIILFFNILFFKVIGMVEWVMLDWQVVTITGFPPL